MSTQLGLFSAKHQRILVHCTFTVFVFFLMNFYLLFYCIYSFYLLFLSIYFLHTVLSNTNNPKTDVFDCKIKPLPLQGVLIFGQLRGQSKILLKYRTL